MVDLSIDLTGLKLSNPIVPASGCFGYGEEFKDLYDLNILGSFVFKGTTLEPRYGNELPRVTDCPSGMLNAVGLQNPGIDVVIERELPNIKTFFKKPIIANVSGFSVDEYALCCEKLDDQEQVGIVELNISCPNVKAGGMTFGTDAKKAAEVVCAARKATKKPLFVKLSPNVTSIADIARACEAAGADGISLINTLLGFRVDLKTRRAALANGYGGLSGPAVLPVALRMVSEVYRAVKLPIMGMGGVVSADDVIEMMLCGASAVQVGAMNLKDPWCCKKIIEGLPARLESLGIQHISEIIGGAQL